MTASREPAPGPDPILVFDGMCNLCHATVRFILAHELDHRIRFAACQSPAGASLLESLGMPAMPSSFVLIENGEVWERSAAAARLAAHLRFPWRMMQVIGRIPKPLADRAYGIVARNRYRLFGRHDVCDVPVPECRSRFL